MEQAHPTALLLNQEIAAVVTAMRHNSKWAVVPTRYSGKDDEVGDDPWLDEFKLLRRRVFQWKDWSAVDPMDYLTPFMEVIRSPETSGPITGVALTAVSRFLDTYIIGDTGDQATEAMHAIADAVTQCKFEATDPAADEVVLYKILQVLVACMRCPGRDLLTNDNIISIFQACFRIGHYQTERSKDMSELLTQASRQIMIEMVSIVFKSLADIPDVPMTPTTARSLADLAHSPRLQYSPDSAQGPLLSPFLGGGTVASTAEQPENGSICKAAADVANDSTTAGAAASAGADVVYSDTLPAPQAHPKVVSVDPSQAHDVSSDANGGKAGEGRLPPKKPHKPLAPIKSKASGGEPAHGLDCLVELLGFEISLIKSGGEGVHNDLNVFGLDLLAATLTAGKSAFAQHDMMMALIREDLFQAVLHLAKTSNLACLSGVCQVALQLYVHLGKQLLLQLEAYLNLVLLRVAEGKGPGGSDLQEAALEGLLDFCSQPGFIRDIYTNLDCRIERSNMFEAVCALLSKTAFPVNCPLGAVHLLSMEGLFSILSALAKGCSGVHSWDDGSHKDDPKQLQAIWNALCKCEPAPLVPHKHPRGTHGKGDEAEDSKLLAVMETARVEKHVKSRLGVAADHFNRDYKKGFQFLQTLGLLPAEMDPAAVAQFLRSCPGLNKQTTGELLGEYDDFFLEVLRHFTDTFDFTGMPFDIAIRVYLDSFRLPGEAQKINRIMESFGARYHMQCPDLFKNPDVVYILAYSTIMLNTDQHNSQVPKKMTCNEFIRNNRGINGGDNLPQDFLTSLYDNISKNEIKISTEAVNTAEASPILWSELSLQSKSARGKMLQVTSHSSAHLDRDMFSLMWGPTVAAVSIVLDHAEDMSTVQQALEGLLQAAKLGAYHHVDEVMDSLVVSLSKFTSPLNPLAFKPVVTFGENEKARIATEAVFTVANRYGDSLKSGWKNIMECIVRLYKLNMLPESILLMEAEDPESARRRIPRPSNKARNSSAGSMLSRAFSSLISLEGADSGPSGEGSAREMEATQRTVSCMSACRVEDIFADSKFLRAESLHELVKAIMWASGPIKRVAASGEESDTAQVCLELLIAVALRNRDRIVLIWPLLHEYLNAIMTPNGAKAANPLVARATLGLLRICTRLLPYKESSAEALLKSLQLVLRLDPHVAWDLAQQIATELLKLVKSSAAYIRSARGWKTVCALINMTALHPEASQTSFEAFALVCKDDKLLTPANFAPLLETALVFVDRHAKDPYPTRSIESLDLMESMFLWLLRYGGKQDVAAEQKLVNERQQVSTQLPDDSASSPQKGSPARAEGRADPGTPGSSSGGVSGFTGSDSQPQVLVSELWLSVLQAFTRISLEANEHLRNHAVVILHRSVVASEGLGVWGGLWIQVMGDLLLPLMADLARYVSTRYREFPGVDKSLRISVNMVTKTLLQYLMLLAPDPDFPELWARILQVLQDCTKNRIEELSEAVPETLKNVLLVMASRGVLTRDWKDSEGRALWDMTWHKAHSISSGLSPQLLVSSGLEKQVPRGPAPSSPSQAAPQGPPATPIQNPPSSLEGAGQSTPQAAAGNLDANVDIQRVYSSQPPLGAQQEGREGSTAPVQGSSFPPESGTQPERPSEGFRSVSDHPVQSASSQPGVEGGNPTYHADTAQHLGQQQASSGYSDSSQNPGQFSSQYSQNPNHQMGGPPQLGRLSPPGKLSFAGMASEPSSHKLSALEERYATGVPVTADEAFNKALQQQHHRQGSWGSNTSVSSLTGPAASGAAAEAASGPVTDNVSSSRLLATIHSGIPSTDDDGPLFAELHKLVAEEESEEGVSGQDASAPGLQSSRQEGQHENNVNLNQAPSLRQLNVVRDQDQQQQQLMGSPRIHMDELSGGLILAPGSETTASVSEPLADIAGGKSGTEAEIEIPYETTPTAGFSGGHSGSIQATRQQQQQQHAGQGSSMHTQPGTDDCPSTASVGQEQTARQSKDLKGDEYSEQQQAQQASSGCKQS
ncbi:hypothetical protein WJX77_003321 [Trebouxia sp. C0004]